MAEGYTSRNKGNAEYITKTVTEGNYKFKLSSSELDVTGQEKEGVDTTQIKAAYAWLKTLMSKPSAHVLNITLGALLNGTNAVTKINVVGGSLGDFRNSIVAGIGAVGEYLSDATSFSKISYETASAINAIADELKNPNLAGIPIHADVEKESQDITVAKNLYIRESSARKEFVVDNTVPQLRTWRIAGYLLSNPAVYPSNAALLIKPDLMLQRNKLQQYIDSRLPILFKTHDNRFYKVLISHMDTEYTVQGTNALKIDLTLTEFRVLEANYENLDAKVANPGSAEV